MRKPNWDVDKVLPLIRAMGAGTLRDDLSWEACESVKGQYAVPPDVQHWIDACDAAHMRVILILVCGHGQYKNPLDPEAYAKFCGWAAKTFKGKVAALEISNEPSNFGFRDHYGGAWNGINNAPWVAGYGHTVRLAAAAIRRADPDAVILENNTDAPWIYGLRKNAGDYAQVDGIDLHPYPVRFPPETLPGAGPTPSSAMAWPLRTTTTA